MPMDNSVKISRHQQLILDVLRENGGWMNRKEIAIALGRPNEIMQPADTQALDRMQLMGLVEIDEEIQGVAKIKYIYRAL